MLTDNFYIPLTMTGTIAVTVWFASLWLNKQFNNIKGTLYDKIDSTEKAILNKLEYHERHDDQRFAQINNDLWSVRLALARNGKETKTEPVIRRETESQGIS